MSYDRLRRPEQGREDRGSEDRKESATRTRRRDEDSRRSAQRDDVQLKAVDLAATRRTAPSWQADYEDHWSLVAGQPVQAKADGAVSSAAVQDHAARGVEGTGAQLPHLEPIQRAFGHHDVGEVRAHVGGAAAEATTAIGAEAYATGSNVAFRGAPDLHTAAHEAAHVVQQRAGVQLYGGVGENGDRYEQHADAVADAVVRGDSAVGLLDHGPSGGIAGPAVQRKGDPDAERDEKARAEFQSGERPGHLKKKQPTSAGASGASNAGAFPMLPTAAGVKVQDYSDDSLTLHLNRVPRGDIANPAIADLGRGWREHIDAGHSTKTAEGTHDRVEVMVGYQNAKPRGDSTYAADLLWRIEVTDVETGASRDVQIARGGRIEFSTEAPIEQVRPKGKSRSVEQFSLDPTDREEQQGALSCDAASPVGEDCFFTPDERARTIKANEQYVGDARQHFIRACQSLEAQLKAAQEADAAFTGALVEFALGFGLAGMMKLGSRLATKMPNALGTAIKDNGADVADQILDLSDAKKQMNAALAGDLKGNSGKQKLMSTIRLAADAGFTQILQTVPNRNDAEQRLLARTFGGVTQEGYEAELRTFLSLYTTQVAPIGVYERTQGESARGSWGSGDFSERVVWMFDVATNQKRLAYTRDEKIVDYQAGGAWPTRDHSAFLGWVDDAMIPYAIDRHTRIFGPVPDISLGLAD